MVKVVVLVPGLNARVDKACMAFLNSSKVKGLSLIKMTTFITGLVRCKQS